MLCSSQISQTTWKTKQRHQNARFMKNWKLRVWCSLFHSFFMWFARFQILSIGYKFLVLSWLYNEAATPQPKNTSLCLIDWNKFLTITSWKSVAAFMWNFFLEFNLESQDTIDRTSGIFTFYIIFLSIWRWQQNWLYQVGARDSAPPARFLLRKERHTRAVFKACWESQESLQ